MCTSIFFLKTKPNYRYKHFSIRKTLTSEMGQRDGIFEKEDKKLAFVHHKKVVVISNFTTEVVSSFEASNVTGYIFLISSNERTW